MFDAEKYVKIDGKDFKVKLLVDTVAREPNEIIGINMCKDEKHLIIITGKNLIKAA